MIALPIKLNLRPRKTNLKRRPALKKKKSSSGCKVITKTSFDVALKKSFTAAIEQEGSKSSSWVKSELLGRGSFGSVYRATNKNEKAERAIKTAELSRASSLMDEARILLRLKSPFVVRCFGDEIAHQQYNLVLEYCPGKSIADLIEDNQGRLSEFDVTLFARDVLSGLRYIHDEGIIHCDIKPDNLLLSPIDRRIRPNGYITKIGDFGLAMAKGSIEYGNGSGHQRGTTRYMAPELITHGIVHYGVDVWALGCTVLEMLTGENVWGEHGDLASDQDWVNLIGYSDLVPHIPDWLSEDAKDFLSLCLEKDGHKRCSSHSLENHPFVTY